MHAASVAASDVLGMLWAFGLPVAYIAFRGLLIPRAVEHSRDLLPSLRDDTVPEQSDNVRGGTLVFAVLAIVSLLFFLSVAGSDIGVVMRAKPAWGSLTCLLGLTLIVELAMVEWLYQQNNRYTDLLSDADQQASAERASRYARVAHAARVALICWGVAFGCAIFWLWQISRG